jgi:starch phosphorylase
VQFIFAGKAHPADQPGKELIKRIANLRRDPRFAGRIVFIEDYDINVGRHLVQGVDVWLNNPRRPLEASGTSGMKVVLNGGLNCSILDGWWAEAFNGKNGFALGNGTQHVDDEVTDARDGQHLLHVLRDEVVELFYDRDADGLPGAWIERMIESIATCAARFSAHRMVMDYVDSGYLVAAGGLSADMNVR